MSAAPKMHARWVLFAIQGRVRMVDATPDVDAVHCASRACRARLAGKTCACACRPCARARAEEPRR